MIFGTFSNLLPASVIFAVIHFNVAAIGGFFFAGLVYVYLYETYKTIWVPIIVHGIYNYWVYTGYFSDSQIVDHSETNIWIKFFLILFHLALAAVALYRIRAYKITLEAKNEMING